MTAPHFVVARHNAIELRERFGPRWRVIRIECLGGPLDGEEHAIGDAEVIDGQSRLAPGPRYLFVSPLSAEISPPTSYRWEWF